MTWDEKKQVRVGEGERYGGKDAKDEEMAFFKRCGCSYYCAGSEDTSTETTPVMPVPAVVECRSDAIDIATPGDRGVMK